MQPLLLSASICLLAFSFYPAKKTPVSTPINLGVFVYTVPLDKEPSPEKALTKWWHEYLEYDVNEAFLAPLLAKIDSGNVDVYEPVYPFTKKLTKAETELLLHPRDSVWTEDPNNPGNYFSVVITHALIPYGFVSITFHEEWMYDEQKQSLEKKVKGIVLNEIHYDENYTAKVKPVIYIPFNDGGQVTQTQPVSITYAFHQQKGNGKTDTLLAAFKRSTLKKETTLYVPEYPFNVVLNKKQKESLRQNRTGFSNEMQFYEEWHLDAGKMTFSKSVKGVILSDQFISANKILFLPLNNYQPAAPARDVFIPAISYGVYYKNYIGDGTNADVINGNVNPVDSFAHAFSELIRTYRLPAFPRSGTMREDDPFDPKIHLPMSNAEVDQLYNLYDTAMIENPETGNFENVLTPIGIPARHLDGFRFNETWSFNPQKAEFEKNVRAIGLLCYNEEMRRLAHSILLINAHVFPLTNKAEIQKPAFLIRSGIRYSVVLDAGEETLLTEKGIPYIDYTGTTYRNIAPSKRYALIAPLLSLALSGKQVVYDTLENSQVLRPDELRKRMDLLKDSTYVTGEISGDYTLLNEIIFDEDWYFNPGTGQFYKKVNSITFSKRQPDDDFSSSPLIVYRTPVFMVKIK
ncbi:MAG TPA: hypothetical protein VI731_05875 [Bacteroidia bacterium]|nr:hypothetical protein [Bacteroidia bacterium]